MWMWSTGINRNIVECKVRSGKAVFKSKSFVLIETLWNVKTVLVVRIRCVFFSINRNIVECKVELKQKCKFLCVSY